MRSKAAPGIPAAMPRSRRGGRRAASRGRWIPAVVLALASAGCAVPFLRPLHTPATLVRDDGLRGTWLSEGKTRVQAVVVAAEGAAYRVTLDVWHDGEHKTTLVADLSLVRLEGELFADLELAKEARNRVAQTYGLLLLPMHQIFRLERAGDTLRVRSLDDDWLEEALRRGVISLAHEYQPGEDGEVLVITAPTDELQRFFRENAARIEAFRDVATFERTNPGKPEGSPGTPPPR